LADVASNRVVTGRRYSFNGIWQIRPTRFFPQIGRRLGTEENAFDCAIRDIVAPTSTGDCFNIIGIASRKPGAFVLNDLANGLRDVHNSLLRKLLCEMDEHSGESRRNLRVLRRSAPEGEGLIQNTHQVPARLSVIAHGHQTSQKRFDPPERTGSPGSLADLAIKAFGRHLERRPTVRCALHSSSQSDMHASAHVASRPPPTWAII
jgi:hypothetical protein